jgi:hypothetical protein
MACFDALAAGYLTVHGVAGVQARAASLLPGLLLARIDGKSPVEYVTEEAQKARVRAVARALLVSPPTTLAEVRSAWQES